MDRVRRAALQVVEPLAASPPPARLLWLPATALLALALWRHHRSVRRARDARVSRQQAETDHTKIYEAAMCMDFPLVFRLSLEFALFRTYAIPTISKLLNKTGKLCNQTALRYDETDLLTREMIENGGVDCARGLTAVRRMNASHAMYANNIRNEDMVYTLCAFIVEPSRWVARFETRPFLPCEEAAGFKLWTDIGRAMGIENIPNDLGEALAYYETYEKKHMKFAPSNARLADQTTALLVSPYPAFLRPAARHAVYALLDERIRLAMGFPKPSAWVRYVILSVMRLRAWTLRNFVHPRTIPLRRTPPTSSVSGGQKRCPLFHVYDITVPEYKPEDLGSAPRGQLVEAPHSGMYVRASVA